MHQDTEFLGLRRSLTVAAAVILGLSLFSLGLLPVHAQDDGVEYWAEVNIGGPQTVFVPADCVSGISLERQSPGAVPDVSQADLNSFQRATIVCDTPLYDLPGGSAIEGEMLNQGSSWLVNPVLWPSLSLSALRGGVDQAQPQTAQTTLSIDTTRDTQRLTGQRWAEVALTPITPRVYVPAECVAGVPIKDTLTWVTSRDESLAQAQEDVTDGDLDFSELSLGTIVCDVGVYTTPGGTQIEGEVLMAGQTWFVSPYLWVTAPLNTAQITSTVDITDTEDLTDTEETTDAEDLTDAEETTDTTYG